MATITKGTTFASGDVVTPTKLNNLVDAATVSNIQTADIADSQITAPKIANGAVTSAKLGSDIILVPAGAVMPFAMNSAPTGWLWANGTAVSRTTYAALFAAIGTTYGTGDGNSTFNLPDLRGYFVRGAGTNSDGIAAGTFGAKQGNTVGPHTHSGRTGNDSPDHSHGTSYSDATATWGASAFEPIRGWADKSEFINKTAQSGGASTRHQHDFTTSSQSPAGTTETRPANIALLYCIKV